MKKATKSAQFQLLELIKKLSKDSKNLNNNEFISVVGTLKSISTNQQFVANLIQSLQVLNQTKIHHKDNLTKREKQVLLLIGEGLKNDAIASHLNISKSTIETHRKNMRKKLKLSRTDDLFALALLFSVQYKSLNGDDI